MCFFHLKGGVGVGQVDKEGRNHEPCPPLTSLFEVRRVFFKGRIMIVEGEGEKIFRVAEVLVGRNGPLTLQWMAIILLGSDSRYSSASRQNMIMASMQGQLWSSKGYRLRLAWEVSLD